MSRGIGKPYVKTLDSQSDLPPPPPHGLNWCHKVANLVFLLFIALIKAFTALGCIKGYLETIFGESIKLVRFTP